MKIGNIIILALIVLISLSLTPGLNVSTIENLAIPSAIGFDIEENSPNDVSYKAFIDVYIFGQKSRVLHKEYLGKSGGISEARNDRQRKIDRRFVVGLEKIDIITEKYARYGVRNMVDVLFINPLVNDTAYVVVCKNDIPSILDYKISGFPTSGDYIEGMVKNAYQYDFFPKDFKILDVFISLDSEGRKVILPYIETTKEGLKITGEALFKDDKMVAVVDKKNMKLLNILNKTNGSGILTIQKEPGKYVDYYGKVKRTVKCTKVDDKYKFNIYLEFKGNILSNQLYKNIMSDSKVVKQFEEDLAKETEAMCYGFLSKMKNEYKIDCLELGRIAAAKYGKDTGTDWDKVVCSSEINVDVTIKLDNQGRGDY